MKYLSLLSFLFLCHYSGSTAAETLPLEHISALPMVERPLISPDGQHILAISSVEGDKTIVVSKYASVEMATIVRLERGKDRINWVRWANNDRIVFSASYPKIVYTKRVRIDRLYAVNIDGTDLRELKLNKIQRHEYADRFSDIRLLSTLPKDKDHILVQTYTGRDPSPAVFKFNIYDGDIDKVVSAAEEIDSWVTDKYGNIHIGIKRDYDAKTEQQTTDIFYRADLNDDKWENIYSYRSFEDFYVSPVGVSEDKKTLYVETDFEVYKNVIRAFDIEKQAFGEILYQKEGFDIDNAIIRDGVLVGAAYTDHYYRIEYSDPDLQARQAMVKQTFPQYKSYIVSNSADKNKLIVLATSTNSPNKYFLVDLASKKASFWLSQYPYLEGKKLPGKLNYEFKAADGTVLYGYFTPGKNGPESPLIVLPHGGPNARDTMDFDIWVQMLARHGYAVLQVNFRGSTGYGNKYTTSGDKQWGKLMQSDVYDAVKWAESMELADTDNMCMVGASYGGYVALVAGYQQADMFRCIVSVAGISDLPALVKSDSIWDGYKAFFKNRVGDIKIEEDLKDMENNSAINHISSFKAPVLLIHGKNDERVHFSQSEIFYKKMKAQRKKVKLMMFDDGTHFVDAPKNREKAFAAIDNFLKKHLK